MELPYFFQNMRRARGVLLPMKNPGESPFPLGNFIGVPERLKSNWVAWDAFYPFDSNDALIIVGHSTGYPVLPETRHFDYFLFRSDEESRWHYAPDDQALRERLDAELVLAKMAEDKAQLEKQQAQYPWQYTTTPGLASGGVYAPGSVINTTPTITWATTNTTIEAGDPVNWTAIEALGLVLDKLEKK